MYLLTVACLFHKSASRLSRSLVARVYYLLNWFQGKIVFILLRNWWCRKTGKQIPVCLRFPNRGQGFGLCHCAINVVHHQETMIQTFRIKRVYFTVNHKHRHCTRLQDQYCFTCWRYYYSDQLSHLKNGKFEIKESMNT